MTTRTLDLGCGASPRNPFNADEIYGIDVKPSQIPNVICLDLALERTPYPDNAFTYVTAFDILEHIPRVLYLPSRSYPFVNLMSEIWRVLAPGGLFLSFTPAVPKLDAFKDPTHVNFITETTFLEYFCEPLLSAGIYGFKGRFGLTSQEWRENHLLTILQKK